jgi:hypothetical protein
MDSHDSTVLRKIAEETVVIQDLIFGFDIDVLRCKNIMMSTGGNEP